MVYELSPLFSLIASASATIVAIVGGFIASKLISLSTERTEVDIKIAEIAYELDFLLEQSISKQAAIDDEDALCFIDNAIEGLVNNKILTQKYEEQKKPSDLSYNKMQSYWTIALQVKNDFTKSLKNSKSLNEDGIPVDLAVKLKDKNFEYEVATMVASEIERMGDQMNFSYHTMTKMPRMTGIWYSKLSDEISSISSKREWLEIQKKQLETRCSALEKPKGMKSGLIIIILFAITCIIIPMLWLDYTTTVYKCYLIANVVAIGVFSLNLISIIGYFIYLLRWERRKK